MSTTECGAEIRLAKAPGSIPTVAARLVMRARSVWRVLHNRLAANPVGDLDDHQLDDIGLSRRDVITALDRSGILDDPSLLLSRAARERSRSRFARAARH
jgi:uncharacterized protein YjiS (DUF1127 family)